MTDTERLDFLTSQPHSSNGWVVRLSTMGRGLRLHQSHDWPNQRPTPREAIDEAIRRARLGCSCGYHAPEQHGPEGCEQKDGCEWNGLVLKESS